MSDRIKSTAHGLGYSDVVILLKHYDEYIAWSLISFLKERDTTPRIMVYVASQYRRQGLGTILVNKCEDYIKRHHKKKIKVIPWDDRAASFFGSLGFKRGNFIGVATKKI